MFKKLCDKIGFKNGGTKELATILGALFLFAIIFGVVLHTQRANAGECNMEADKKDA